MRVTILISAWLISVAVGEQTSLQSTFATLSEELQKATVVAGGREGGLALGNKQIAANLLSTLSSSEIIGQVEKELLEEISVLFEGILADLKTDVEVKNTELNMITTEIDYCETLGNVTEGNISVGVFAKKDEHQTCRDAQVLLYRTQQAECGKLKDFLEEVDHDHYCSEIATYNIFFNEENSWEDYIETWGKSLIAITTEITEDKNKFVEFFNNCTDAENDYSEKNSECDTLQETFENSWCEWSIARNDRCDSLRVCYDYAVTSMNAKLSGWSGFLDSCTNFAMAITWLNCMVEHLIEVENTNMTAMQDACEFHKSANYSQYNITLPSYPGWSTVEETCDRSEVQPTPANSVPFANLHYNDTDWTEFPDNDAVEPVSDCTNASAAP